MSVAIKEVEQKKDTIYNTEIPIAETFTSVQGEGGQAGIRMTFFRLAGCTVGKRFPQGHYLKATDENAVLPLYPSYINRCTDFSGHSFPCDTNYNIAEKVTISNLLKRIPKGVEWVSITGGEPLMHMDKVVDLCRALREQGYKYHIETSGTIIPDDYIYPHNAYLACSPKANYLPEVIAIADEVRLMVDENFDIESAMQCIRHATGQIYLCPLSTVDDVTKISRRAMGKCMQLIELPEFYKARISIQSHKVLGVR